MWDAINGIGTLLAAGVAVWMARRDVVRARSAEEKERLAKSEANQITEQYLEIKQRFVEVQNRLLTIEETRERDRTTRRAELRGRLRKNGPHAYSLVVRNNGQSLARNVDVWLDGIRFPEHGASMGSIPSSIPSNDEVSCPLGLHLQCAPPFALRIIWEDESGVPGEVESTLTF